MAGFRQILVAFGANLPSDVGSVRRPPADAVRAAMLELSENGLELIRKSRLFASPCFPAGAGPEYVNAVASYRANMSLGPEDILAILHQIEARHGRLRLQRWAGRTLDLDLLAVDDLVLPDAATQAHWRGLAAEDQARLAPEQLILPHPRVQDRAFVLVPLCEVAPEWYHPVLGKTVEQLCAALSAEDRAAIVPLGGQPGEA